MFNFKPDNKASTNGTSYHGVAVTVNPKRLTAWLGNGQPCDDYKVSCEWVIVEENSGAVLTIYDWKSTSMYSGELPTPEQFWSAPLVHLHIGHDKKHLAVAHQLAATLLSLKE